MKNLITDQVIVDMAEASGAELNLPCRGRKDGVLMTMRDLREFSIRLLNHVIDSSKPVVYLTNGNNGGWEIWDNLSSDEDPLPVYRFPDID